MSQESKSKYQLYLESDHWKGLRESCFIRDGYRCMSCRTKSNLNGHHLTYRQLWDCTKDDVVTLCWECHEALHAHMRSSEIRNGILSVLDALSILRQIRSSYRQPVRPEVHVSEELEEAFPPQGDGPFVITRTMMRAFLTEHGGYTTAVFRALNVPLPLPSGWYNRLLGSMITKEVMMRAYDSRKIIAKRTERRRRNRENKDVFPVNFKAA